MTDLELVNQPDFDATLTTVVERLMHLTDEHKPPPEVASRIREINDRCEMRWSAMFKHFVILEYWGDRRADGRGSHAWPVLFCTEDEPDPKTGEVVALLPHDPRITQELADRQVDDTNPTRVGKILADMCHEAADAPMARLVQHLDEVNEEVADHFVQRSCNGNPIRGIDFFAGLP